MPMLAAGDGELLQVREWAAAAPGHGTVVLVHGLGEHVGRYANVVDALTAAGWRVVGHDHRGHGHSGGRRGALPRLDDLVADLALVIDHARGDGRLVLLGHSLGGLVAGRFVAEGLAPAPAPWHRPVDGLVMTSPALDIGLGAPQKALLAVLAPLAPGLAIGNGLKPEWISRDPVVVDAYRSDPLVHDRVTPRLVRFMVDAGRIVQERSPSWVVPTLLLWAGADRCVDPAGSAAFASAAPPEVVRTHRYPDAFHEILNEPDRAEVLSEIRRWLADLDA